MYTWARDKSRDTGQRIPFWQLSIDHNMDVHYQVKQIEYALNTYQLVSVTFHIC